MNGDRDSIRLSKLLTEYTDQECIGWPACFAYLRTFHARRISELTWKLARDGDLDPIYLDPFNKRVLDGHHRIAVWEALGWVEVAVKWATKEDLDDSGVRG